MYTIHPAGVAGKLNPSPIEVPSIGSTKTDNIESNAMIM